MEDQNVIEHLFDVERQAAELMADAQKEYDKRIGAVREKANTLYKESYEKIVKEEEENLASECAKCDSEYNLAVESYRAEVGSWNQNKEAFNSLLTELLFNK